MSEFEGTKEFLREAVRNPAASLLILLVFVVMPLSIVLHMQKQWRIERIMKGPIRGDKEAMRFTVPDCPKYNDIPEANLVTFSTVGQARKAGYYFTVYCDEDILSIREINESGEVPEFEHPGDPQYR